MRPRVCAFHALRHFYASGLIAAGADAKQLTEALGHSSIDVTIDVYGHLLPDGRPARRGRVNAFADLVAGAETREAEAL